MAAETVNRLARRLPTWPFYLAAPLPPAWLFYQAVIGRLGVDPVKAMEHQIGLLGLQVLIASLCITPLRRFTGVNLIRFRRALGLIAFFYISLHLLVWLLLDVRIASQILTDIYKRPYITVGMVAFLLLVPLALTSNRMAIRRLGARWRRLHWLVYPAILLGAVHFVMLRKGWQVEPLLYLAGIVLLLVIRLPVRRWVAAWG
ncbi:protein-methionine-sulfoxide reductase heme-binding subunit MsrQ [Celeribacter indicus]|uniref:Protein-methionine-sulfoxide reductase heme-binding subunit MsrQ n=1 Tax=Celeribacter indicus TaxID=1208324 RepID=A0A0B5DWT8_9RHOB|nr:protein-methionine-sulfoxide reductase heme-binding subunit MsrQ [Celeribacter indicus]AJE45181.1 sulfite oxidase subunit YedZ [Celeribacter indicus]SDX25632.1 sulfoxide reductase heme-binding subunit YedZ [Celeribacter indicus]